MSVNGELAVERVSSPAAIEKHGPVQPRANALLDIIAQPELLQKLDTDKIEALLNMQERLENQRRRDLFFEALTRIQDKAPRIKKAGLMDRGPGKGQIAYATFEDIDAVMRPIYRTEGFSVTWDSPRTESLIRVVGRFTAFGHTEEREWSCSPDTSGGKQNPQAAGSTVSYGKRYISIGFWNIVTEGEDTNGARAQEVEPITQGQADDIRTRMNDLRQREPGRLLSILCKKYSVERPEDLRISQYAAVIKDVEDTERKQAEK